MKPKMVAVRGRYRGTVQGWRCSACDWEYGVLGLTATGDVEGIVGSRAKEHAQAQRQFKKHLCKPQPEQSS
jgi:hypothetical protein